MCVRYIILFTQESLFHSKLWQTNSENVGHSHGDGEQNMLYLVTDTRTNTSHKYKVQRVGQKIEKD